MEFSPVESHATADVSLLSHYLISKSYQLQLKLLKHTNDDLMVKLKEKLELEDHRNNYHFLYLDNINVGKKFMSIQTINEKLFH